jgi:hypothetical protein
MKNLLTYKLFETEILDEALEENRWLSDWKKMPEWKELEKLGFYDASTPGMRDLSNLSRSIDFI